MYNQIFTFSNLSSYKDIYENNKLSGLASFKHNENWHISWFRVMNESLAIIEGHLVFEPFINK